MPVDLNDRRVDCDFIANRYDDVELALLCQDGGIYTTCRGSCGVCEDYLLDFEEGVSSVDPYYSDSESGLTFTNMYGMDAISEGYGNGNGYYHGTVSGSYTIFNGWASPGNISCPGGSFTLKQVYITPAWTDYVSYTFTGTKSNGSTVSTTFVAGTTDEAILYTDWPDFTDLVDIYFSANSFYSSQLVFDDLVVQFHIPCNGATDVVNAPVEDGSRPQDPPQ